MSTDQQSTAVAEVPAEQQAREREVVNRVLASFAHGGDARLRDVMQALTRHLDRGMGGRRPERDPAAGLGRVLYRGDFGVVSAGRAPRGLHVPVRPIFTSGSDILGCSFPVCSPGRSGSPLWPPRRLSRMGGRTVRPACAVGGPGDGGRRAPARVHCCEATNNGAFC